MAAAYLLVGAGLVSAILIAIWIIESGVLPWAVLGGALTFLATWRLSGDLGAAWAVGVLTMAAILVMGIMSVVSPGWYRIW
ncbi:MAG: hypothetical protein OXS35_07075 [Dehalococcoidia bacterium]|nr:hypothetical protein [Dehalococcoidia bacterium]